MKTIIKKTGKILLWILTSIVVLIVLFCTLFTIPAIQTYVAQKAANFLSDKLQAEVSIGKLRIDFNLNIQLEEVRLNDLYGNNLISARKGSLSFPSFNTGTANVEIRNIVLDSADVTLRKYESDTVLNLQFFVDFLKPKEKKNSIIDLQTVELKNSRFQLRNDALAGKDREGVWNYSNMIIEDINIKCEQILIIGDSLNLYIDKLSARERSGFQVRDFSGHLIICRTGIHCLETNILTKNLSEFYLDFRFDYTDFPDFQDFMHKIVFNTDLYQGRLNLADLVYFVPAFKGMNNTVNVMASVRGALSDFKIRDLDLSYGQATRVKGDIDLTGLPVIEEMLIDFDIEHLKTNLVDLASFSLPKNRQIPIPDILKKINYVEMQGHFLGIYNNFFVDVDMVTAVGEVSCELMLNNRSVPISYDAKLQTNALELGNLLDNKDLGNVNMQGTITGEGFNMDDFNFQFHSTVSDITFRNNTVKDIILSGNFQTKQFKSQIHCDDEDFNLDFNGFIDFNQQSPHYNFNANVQAINLSRFRLFRPDSNVIVSAYVNTDITGKDVEHFQGQLKLDSIVYKEKNVSYSLPDFVLNIEQENYPTKDIHLKSDILNMDMSGSFTYRQAFAVVQNNLHVQLPNVIPSPAALDSTQAIFAQQFDLSLKVTESIPLLNHFVPDVRLNKGLTLKFSLNQSKSISDISIEAPQLDIRNKHRLNNLTVVNRQNGKTYQLGMTCDSYFKKWTDTLPDLQEFAFEAIVSNNVVDFLATATGNDNNKLQDILIEGAVTFLDMEKLEIEIELNNGSIAWDDDMFLFDASNYAYLARDSIYIRNFGLHSQKGKSITARSRSVEEEGNGIYFNFNKIDLGIFNVFLNQYQISLEGVATGKGEVVRNAYGYALGSDFDVDDFQFNNVSMGYFQGKTFWNNIERKLFIQAFIFETKEKLDNSLLVISGNFDPRNKYIDLTGRIDSLNIKILEPYLKSFASKVEGFGTGELTFKGKMSKPKLEGSILLKKATLGIGFLQTNYFIESGTIKFIDTGFIFENTPFHDGYNGRGTVSGIITHNRLRDFGVDLKINATNLSVLNTTLRDNNLFYGKAFVTGNASIYGLVKDILSIDANVTTNPSTDITLSLDWNTTAVESDFITFVSHETEKKEDTLSPAYFENSAMQVNLKMTATPDAIVRVLLDPSIGGTIISKGSGTIDLILDKNNDLSLFGIYTISSGEFDLAFGDILTRIFKIESGGYISWNGDPTQGIMNVRAVQAAKVSVSNLFENEGNTRLRPVSVNNILSLNGQLLKPDFSFTFDLPDADEITKSQIYNKIDTANREEMIGQVVNVLLLGTFKITDNSEGNSGANNNLLGYSISEMISSQLKKMVSSISPNIDVRMSYLPGESAEETEYSVDVGGSFFNNKLTVSTSMGILEQQDLNSQERFLGDITVEYKLISDGSLRVRAFNVSNSQDALTSTYSSTYSQGMGLAYLKDFDKFKDLFVRKSRKKKKNRNEQELKLQENESNLPQ
ncbi:MAG: translocation/assembly module TamB domain-containing protein [Bacteroidales bacterium]|jgi:hypothetical protein|nr:translocation/assembly module TamB domain-containing protein [Bacteroidales bacterium]